MPSSFGWRGVVSYLAREEIVAYGVDGDLSGEFPYPHLMTLKGRGNLSSDMVAVAWAGPPLIDFAKAFSQHSDDDLEKMRGRYGSLRSEAFIDELLRFKRWADDLGIEPDDTIVRAPRFGFDLREMRRDLIRTARVVGAEAEAAKLRHQWKLTPFEPQIEAVINAWRSKNPATSMSTGIGVGIRVAALRKALESYVLQYGKMPDGEVRAVPEKFMPPFTVDIEKLREGR